MAICPRCQHEEPEAGTPCPNDEGWCCVDEHQLEEYADENVLLGQIVADRFAVFRVLGRGGMGWVYEASQLPIKRRVALKVLRSDYVNDELVRSRFFREARVLGMLQHPNLVTLHDYGVTDAAGEESLYIAMELLRGRTLTSTLRRPKLLKAQRLVQIARGIAGGLAEAHRNGVVHRDLKPDNILLVRDAMRQEVVKLVDFGIARMSTANTVLTKTGMVFGTPAYMSPEQATGDSSVGPQADVYAFGVLLYRMLVGKLPFDGDVPLQVLMAHINKPPPRIELRPVLEVPQQLLDFTYHCLEKKPENRPEDGAELEGELAKIAVLLQEGKDLVSGDGEPVDSGASDGGPSQDDIATQPSIDTEPDEPPTINEVDDVLDDDDTTLVVGGDFEMFGNTVPSGEMPAANPGAEPSGTASNSNRQESGVAAAAYRVDPSGSPAPLRESPRRSPWPAIGLVVAVISIFSLLLYLTLRDSDTLSKRLENRETISPGDLPTSGGVPGGAKNQVVTGGGSSESKTEGGEAPTDDGIGGDAGSGADEVPAPGSVERREWVEARIDQLSVEKETLLTIVDPGERERRGKEIDEEIKALQQELKLMEP